ncbi:phosphate ABC transporter, permease protein PstA [Nocardiopsis sp. TSRI0078]|uniref:phosphate ABC transporter permease PstA n=1 Tax=unclassified Nocardiopsis TaxID=2649073 RepID=UPI00093FD580|nr:phosphate ABC transporter permease PstA [Nocardiopsis sp. TSRI0078]OKI13670.1 phosphate ABC transporter, permease protein PstA [Nocardiopsis sp. TSRI0078]
MSTATTTPPSAQHTPLSQRPPGSGYRRLKDRSASVLLTAAMVLAMIPLILIIFEVTRRGIGVVSLEFFTETEPPPRREGGGYAAGFFGTLYIMALSILMSIPLGIATAVYVVEYGPNRLTSAIRFFTDVMTGIPSIFVGLFVYGLLVIGWGGMGFGTFAGAVAIGVMMLPIVTRSAEEMLRLVPEEMRNASYGLGARKWQTIMHTVLPAAAPGLATGSMLAVARGIGETAPLLLTAFGSGLVVTAFQGEAQGAVPMQLYRGATQPFEAGIDRAWGAALCLFVLVLLFTVLARWIGSRGTR